MTAWCLAAYKIKPQWYDRLYFAVSKQDTSWSFQTSHHLSHKYPRKSLPAPANEKVVQNAEVLRGPF